MARWVRLCVLNVRAQVLFQVRELDPTYSVVRAAKKKKTLSPNKVVFTMKKQLIWLCQVFVVECRIS